MSLKNALLVEAPVRYNNRIDHQSFGLHLYFLDLS
jgi:hypothetical protein